MIQRNAKGESMKNQDFPTVWTMKAPNWRLKTVVAALLKKKNTVVADKICCQQRGPEMNRTDNDAHDQQQYDHGL